VSTVYLDYNATAPVRPEAADAIAHALRIGGNPSSIHSAGRAARAVVETAREDIAALTGARPEDVAFTSGGSEANVLALYSAIAQGTRRLIIGSTEHPSLTEAAAASGLPVEALPVDSRGVSDLDWLSARLKGWDAADGNPFVALMLANNETGVIQPIAEAAAIVHDAGGWLHVDAVQAAGKIAIDRAALGADTLTISAHKLGGPQGSGALIVRPGVEIHRRAFGGGQERGRRGGTENTPGIAGFGAAANAARRGLGEPDPTWRDETSARLQQEAGIAIMGEGAPRLPNTLCFAAEGFSSDLQVMGLDLAGVMVSAGSACSSGKVKASPVIAAMGLTDLAGSTIRVSGGWATTREDWRRFADAWLEARARHMARAGKLVEA
jgi:cysteine desulfurase